MGRGRDRQGKARLLRRAGICALGVTIALGTAALPAWAVPPDAPGPPTASPGNATIDVSFAAPLSDGGSPLTGYTASCASSDGGATGTSPGLSSPITVGSLTNGKTYTCSVTATNVDGTSGPSPDSGAAIPATVPDAPAPPSISAGNTQITVTFSAPASNGGQPINNYTATCTSSNGGATGSASNAGLVQAITVSALTNGKSYTCHVTAANVAGTSGASTDSSPAVPSGTPDAPAQPSITAGNTQITVNFGAPPDNGSAITSYSASCTSSNGGTPNSNTGGGSPIVVSGLTNGSTYTCTVTATNGRGPGPASSASGSAVPANGPDAPPTPTVARGNTTIDVTFGAAVNNGSAVSAYNATCTSSDGGVTGSAGNSGAVAPIAVHGLTNGKTYTCTVTATNGVGTGPASTPSAAVVPANAPDAPAQPGVARGAPASIAVSFAAPANNGSAITGYTASCSSSDGGAAGSMTGSASPITVPSLTNVKTYTCTVRATNGVGPGPASPPSASIVVGIPEAPAPPSVSPGTGRVVVDFVAPADNGSAITGYTASCTSSNGGTPGTNGGAVTPITVSGLTNGKTYTCTVTATNAAGTSAPSSASAPVVPNLVPDAPGPATVVAGNAQIVVSFGAPDAHGYAISAYNAICTSTTGGVTGSHGGPSSPITVTGLTNAATYSCAVTATNIIGTGAPSPASAPVVPFTIAAAPSVDNVTIGNASLTVSFTPHANNGAAITSFTVTCYSSRGGGFTGTASGPASPINVTGLSNGWAYICEVTATNAAGTSGPSDPSPAVSVGAPAPPRIVSVVPAPAGGSVGDLKVYFRPGRDNGSKIIQYRALCKSVQTGQTRFHDGTSSPIKVPGTLTGRAYDCTVFSWNNNGAGSESNAVRVVVGTPSAPKIVRIMRVPHGLALAFLPATNNGSSILEYRARCTSTDGGAPSAPLQRTSPIVANNLTPGKTYVCELTALNGRGESPPTITGPIVTTAVEITTGCKGNSGSLRVSPGLLFSINKPHTFRLAAALGHCSGSFARQAKISMTFRSKSPFSCKQAIGKANAGSGTITWTAPAALGTSDAAIQLVFGATHGHVTNARFHGTITSRANLFTDQHVTGTLTLKKGLASDGSGGDCSNTSRLQKFTVTSVTMRIS